MSSSRVACTLAVKEKQNQEGAARPRPRNRAAIPQVPRENAKSGSKGRATNRGRVCQAAASSKGAPPVGRWKGQRGQYVSSLTSHSCPRIRSVSRLRSVWGSTDGVVQAPRLTPRGWIERCRRLNNTLMGHGGNEIKRPRLWPKRTFCPKVSSGYPAALQDYNETASR